MEIIITANSPGEIAGLAFPVVRALKEATPEVKVTIMLLPCPFSSGREEQVAKSIDGVDRVMDVFTTLSFIFLCKNPGFDKDVRMLHLGGDPFFAVLISCSLKCPVWAYEWAQKKWDGFFTGYFARDDKNKERLFKSKIPVGKVIVAGDLLTDAVEIRCAQSPHVSPFEGLTVTLMPGSRFHEIINLIPLFAATCEIIRKEFPKSRFFLPLSPFLDRENLKKQSPYSPQPDGPGVKVSFQDNTFITESGLEIDVGFNSGSLLPISDFIITIPGTSTGEAGAMGVPFYCILPMNRPELIPYMGIFGLAGYIPVIGRHFKRAFIQFLANHTKGRLLALPNIKAGRMVSPESIEVISPQILFDRIRPYLEDKSKRDRIKKELLDVYRPYRRAAEVIVKYITNYSKC